VGDEHQNRPQVRRDYVEIFRASEATRSHDTLADHGGARGIYIHPNNTLDRSVSEERGGLRRNSTYGRVTGTRVPYF